MNLFQMQSSKIPEGCDNGAIMYFAGYAGQREKKPRLFFLLIPFREPGWQCARRPFVLSSRRSVAVGFRLSETSPMIQQDSILPFPFGNSLLRRSCREGILIGTFWSGRVLRISNSLGELTHPRASGSRFPPLQYPAERNESVSAVSLPFSAPQGSGQSIEP